MAKFIPGGNTKTSISTPAGPIVTTTTLGPKTALDVAASLTTVGQIFLLRDITTFASVGLAGQQSTLAPFPRRAKIVQIHVMQGTPYVATDFSVEIFAKNSFALFDRVYYRPNVTSGPNPYRIHETVLDIPYYNEDDLDEIHVKIVPNLGSSNAFAVKLLGYVAD